MKTVDPPKQARSAQTHEKILDALEALLAQRAASAITVADIAGKAAIAPSALYTRFRDKDAAIDALFERMLERYVAQLSALDLAEAADNRQRVAALVDALDRLSRDNLPLLRHIAVEQLAHGRTFHDRGLNAERIGEMARSLSSDGADSDKVRFCVFLISLTVQSILLFPSSAAYLSGQAARDQLVAIIASYLEQSAIR